MARLLYRLGGFAARLHYVVIAVWVILFAGILAAAGLLGGTLQASFSIPGTPSQVAIDMLTERFPQASGATVNVIFEAGEGEDIRDDESLISGIATKLDALPHVSMLRDPFEAANASQISKDDRFAYISVGYDIPTTSITETDAEAVTQLGSAGQQAGLTVAYAGLPAEAAADYSQEAMGLAVAYIILAITFGSLLAAGMPPVTALIGVGIGTGLINVAAAFATISSTAPVLASMLGLAVGIDYALFILSRHRSQLARGMSPRESIAHATATAGSAVIFAGLTVIIALLGLAVVGIPFITIMGQGAALAVVVALLVAVTLLPALLSVFGRLLIPKPGSRAHRREHQLDAPDGKHRSLGSRWAAIVTAKPLLTLVVTVLGLGVLSLPAASLQLTLPDAGYQPVGTQAREAYDLLGEGYGPGFNGPLLITADISDTLDIQRALTALEGEFAGLPDVATVSQAIPNQALDMAIVSITPSSAPDSEQTKQLVSTIRDREPAFEDANGFGYLVTGNTAVGIDISDRLQGALLPFGLVVVGLCIVLLTVVFRSLAVPLTATVGFLLSVGASFGVTTAVFNWGWLAPFVGVDKVGPVISFMPILVMAVLFGLAMDYEVFLVSRMREEFTRTSNARFAVLRGFAGAARVVTAAALIMFSVFVSFVPGGGAVLQPIALALAVGVLVDAFVVRMTLIPAVMMMLGARAWWLPRWLAKILPDVDIEGESVAKMLAAKEWVPRAEGGSANPHNPDKPEGQDDADPAERATPPDYVVSAAVLLADGRTATFSAHAGDVVLVPPDAAALAGAVTGRGPIGDGHATVLGLVMPFEAATLRRRTAYADGRERTVGRITVDEFVRERAALDAAPGHRLRLRNSTFRILDDLGRVETEHGSWRGTSHAAVEDLGAVDRWRLEAAVTLASGREVLAFDTRPLGSNSARALSSAVCAAAPVGATVLIVADADIDLSTKRTVVEVCFAESGATTIAEESR